MRRPGGGLMTIGGEGGSLLLERMEARLKLAKQQYELAGFNGRAGMAIAVGACVEFYMGIDSLRKQDLALPLTLLMGALDDLNSGRVADFLKPVNFQNRHQRSGVHSDIRVWSAVTVELLMRLGFREGIATADTERVLIE